MNSIILEQMRLHNGGFSAICSLLIAVLLMAAVPTGQLRAEGSKDFVGYSGYRLYLDTEDNQQLKVYATEGEFLNLGSSHLGIMDGFIAIYRPDGTLHSTLTGDSGEGIINNNIEEISGPTGGGTTNGAGYIPSVIQVGAGEAGIWTVIFDFPGEDINNFINLLNNQAWNRAAHQPSSSQRVVLAWDITVSQTAAGNDGGQLLNGRVYSNKYISIISGNDLETSPNFNVLTKDGYVYSVDFQDIDPFRFSLGSNSFGIVNGDLEPAYRSVEAGEYIVDGSPDTWDSDSLYLYQLMSEDYESIINNKVFFNPPNTDMPATALVTDIFQNNTHTTWLYSLPPEVASINFTNFEYLAIDPDGDLCDPNTTETGIGGYVVFETTLGGNASLDLDLNGDGDFDDPIDRTLFSYIENSGVDSIFWDGIDGEGNPLPLGDGFTLNYNLSIRGGEVHIFLIDIENNNGGVSFTLLNPDGTTQVNPFYYDHTQVGGELSGGGTTGEPQPTTVLDTYDNNFGDNKIFDYWSYFDFEGNGSGTFMIDVLDNCNCSVVSTPVITGISSDGDYCTGENIDFTATNSNTTNDTTFYTWTGPNNFFLLDTIANPGDFSSFTIDNAMEADTGFYYLQLSTPRDCISGRDSIWVSVYEQPTVLDLQLDNTDGVYCSGSPVTVSATTENQTINYDWTIFSPTGTTVSTGVKTPDVDLQVMISDFEESGTYQIVFNNNNQCTQNAAFDLTIEETPTLGDLAGGGAYCEDDMVVLSLTNPNLGLINYVWTTPSGGMATGSIADEQPITLQLQNFTASNAGTYSIQLMSENGCLSVQDSLEVAVAPTPSINVAVEAAAYCPGQEVNVMAVNTAGGTGDITYTFAGSGNEFTTTVAEGDTAIFTIPEFANDDAGTYFLNIESACSSTTELFDINAFSSVEISDITPPTTYCAGETAIFSAMVNLPADVEVTYTWTFPNGQFFSNFTPGNEPLLYEIENVNPFLVGEYTLSIAIEGQECAIDAVSTTIDVANTPFVGSLTGAGLYCENTPATLFGMNTTPGIDSVTYTWTGPDGQTYINAVGGTDTLFLDIPNLVYEETHGTWTLNTVSSDGCSSPEQSLEIEISPSLFITDMTGEGVYCEGDDVTLTAANGNPNVPSVEWNWYLEFNEPQFDEFGMADSTDIFSVQLENVTVSDTGLYVVVVTNNDGCPVGVGTQYVDVEAAPIVASLDGGGTFCEGESTTITATISNDYDEAVTYTWTSPNGFEISGTAMANESLSVAFNNLTENEIGEYFITVTSPNGCTTEWTQSVTIDVAADFAAFDFNANTAIACFGEEIVLTATEYDDQTTYIWYFDDGTGAVEIANTAEATLTIAPVNFSNAGSYYVEVENTSDCFQMQTADPIMIEVMSGVDAFEDMANGEEGTPVVVDVLDNDLYGTNAAALYTVIINPRNGTASFNDDGMLIYTPEEGFFGTDSLVYQLCSSVCTEVCDEAIVYFEIAEQIIEFDCFIPNFFSPNGDGSNEELFIDCLETLYPDNRLFIFNRWGDEIYQAEPYRNDWSGTFNDKDLPAGTYFYILYLEPEDEEGLQGFITIIR